MRQNDSVASQAFGHCPFVYTQRKGLEYTRIIIEAAYALVYPIAQQSTRQLRRCGWCLAPRHVGADHVIDGYISNENIRDHWPQTLYKLKGSDSNPKSSFSF